MSLRQTLLGFIVVLHVGCSSHTTSSHLNGVRAPDASGDATAPNVRDAAGEADAHADPALIKTPASADDAPNIAVADAGSDQAPDAEMEPSDAATAPASDMMDAAARDATTEQALDGSDNKSNTDAETATDTHSDSTDAEPTSAIMDAASSPNLDGGAEDAALPTTDAASDVVPTDATLEPTDAASAPDATLAPSDAAVRTDTMAADAMAADAMSPADAMTVDATAPADAAADATTDSNLPDATLPDAATPDAAVRDAAPNGRLCASCGGCEEVQSVKGGDHTRAPITYPDPPPTGGPHNPCWARWGVHDAPVGAERWVHNLEHGGVVLLYNCPAGCPAELAQLKQFVTTHKSTLLTAYDMLPVRFAIISWGHRLVADCADIATFEAFYAANFDHGAESNSSQPDPSCPP